MMLPDIPVSFAPLDGIYKSHNSLDLPKGGSLDMLNCRVCLGCLEKRPGYSQYGDGEPSIGGQVVGLFSSQDEEDNTHLYAAWIEGLAKYDSSTDSWTACTGPVMTGLTTRIMSWEVSQNSVVFSMGRDQVMRVPFNTVYAILNANCPPARYLTRFADRLFIAHTVETGATKPFRLRRSVAGDHTNWTGTGSGFIDITEYPYQFRNIRKLGAGLGLHTEKNINLGTRTGIAGAPIAIEPAVGGVGVIAPHTLVDLDDTQLFLGNHGFVSFNGVQVADIDRQLGEYILSVLTPTSVYNNFSIIMFDSEEYISFLCMGGATLPNEAWVWNWTRNIWYPWSVSGPTSGCTHRLDDTTTIDGLVGTIDEQNWQFDSRILAQAYPVMMTGNSDGKIYKWSTAYTSDNGTPILCRWTSKDFTGEDVMPEYSGKMITLKLLTFDYQRQGQDGDLDFEFSADGGVTWSAPQNVPMESGAGELATGQVSYQITGDRIRFRFIQESATATFKILRFTLWFENKQMQRKTP